ncbi:MAG TPA: VIT domain-containing protein [Burkholderiales bacterium]|nr:VIT domain-containing protein [Burkholderiales bacterium]
MQSIRHSTRVAAAALLAALAAGATAADIAVSPPRPQLQIAAPQSSDAPVELRAVRIDTEISGSLALTTVEMTFYNPNRRVLEGSLQFPLLDGQQVVGFGLDVDGRLRDAVPVEKAHGRAIFEDVTRQRIDPGLLQATEGNNFRVRVYPIEPQRSKRAVIRYAETLQARAGRPRYRLPLDFAATLPAFSLRIAVDGAGGQPVIARNPLGDAVVSRSGERRVLEVERRDFAARGMLELELPKPTRARVYTEERDGKTYFYAEVPVSSPTAPRAPPRVVGLIWDSSGSGAARDHAREFSLLAAYFKAMRDGEVRLIRVRDRAEPAGTFRIAHGDWRALRRALEATDYDGATNLGDIAPQAGVGAYLLFSDGLANFGADGFPALAAPVYAVSAALKYDPSRLRHIAHASGGRFVDLMTDAPAAAAGKLLAAPGRLAALESDCATDLVAASPYPERGAIALAGVLSAASCPLRLALGLPGRKPQEFGVRVERARSASRLAAMMWARLTIAQLDGEYALHRAEIGRIGKAFGLVTRETSLIVLDRVEDYARYDITPPAELLAAYRQIRAHLAQARTRENAAHLERVVRQFNDKIAWWERSFPRGSPKGERALRQEPRGEPDSNLRQERRSDIPERVAQDAVAAASQPAAPAGTFEGKTRQRAFAAAPAAESAGKNASAGADTAPDMTIQLRRWTPDAPYLERMRNASAAELYRVYLDERAGYRDSTAFFLDAADQFFERGLTELGLRVVSNLAEMDLENRAILRILGHRLLQAGAPALAIPVFRKVLEISPDEPQSYRDLGLAYAADRQYQNAVDALYRVALRPWHARFPEIALIALAELNAIVVTSDVRLDLSRIDPRLVRNLPLDLRVVLSWDSDNTDIDLWVTDPNGEKSYYGNRLSFQGGRMSPDFTGGYGPEEFSLRQAKPGKYRVEANFYGHNQQIVAGATTLQVRLATRFATREQAERIVTLRLAGRKDVIFVGEFEVGTPVSD